MNEWKVAIKSSGYMNRSLTIVLDAPYKCTLKEVQFYLHSSLYYRVHHIYRGMKLQKNACLARKNGFELQTSPNEIP